MHHELCNLEPDQAATAKNLKIEPAKRYCEVKPDTPPTSPPPTPTAVSTTPRHPLRPPTLKNTYRLQYSICSPPGRITAHTAPSKEPLPA
ncbi:hypothetical protein A2U01_0035965 [Trifolium medium]|uniref:Uncharacterized protein n=1 Tax=Trifolium medium TaxID=97028 RepID=A0A392PRW4_9FABA|nr:hypothetical protein [Trifolium medium]